MKNTIANTNTVAATKKTYKIWRFNAYTLVWDCVALPRNAAFEEMMNQGLNPEDHLIIVESQIPEFADDTHIRKEEFWNMLDYGFDVPKHIPTACRHFEVLTAGASMLRNSGFIMGSTAAVDLVWDRAYAGFSPVGHKVAPNKASSYCGLQFSASRPLQEAYGFDFDIRKMIIVPDGTLEIVVQADVVSADGSKVDLDVPRVLHLTYTDGQSVYDADLFPGKVAPSFSYRASVGAFKGLAVPFNLKKWFSDQGIKAVKDIYGIVHPVEDVQMICAKSCFKQISWTDSWEDFCDAFEQRNGHFCCCVAEHPAKLSRLSYQFVQTLVDADDNDINYLATRAQNALTKYQDPAYACGLLGGNASKFASRYPAFLNNYWAQAAMQQAYEARRNQALGGSVPATGSYGFAACDPVAFMENACGLEVHGCLKAYEVCCFEGADGYKMDVCRSPQLDHSHVILTNRTREVSDYIVHNSTVYFNIFDETTIRLRMDYDGDHVWWTQNRQIISLVEDTNKRIDMRVTDWDAPEAGKPVFNMFELKNMLYKNTAGSQIGIYADNCTRVWSRHNELVERFGLNGFRTVIAWLTWAGNVLIDAAKHGSVDIQTPYIVENAIHDSFEIYKFKDDQLVASRVYKEIEVAKRVLEKCRKNNIEKGVKYQLIKHRTPLPAFCEYAKADKLHPVGDESWLNKVAMSNGVGDRYMTCAADKISEKLTVKKIDGMGLDWHHFLFDQHRPVTVPNLWAKGRKDPNADPEANVYIEQGKFQELVGIRTKEIKEMDLDPIRQAMWLEDRDNAIRKELTDYAASYGETLETVYDLITRNLFKTNWNDEKSVNWATAMFRTYFSVFGDMALEALAKNGFDKKILPDDGDFYTEDDLFIDNLD